MPYTKVSSVMTETAPIDLDLFVKTGAMRADQFAICDKNDRTKQLRFDLSAIATGTTILFTPDAANTGVVNTPAVAVPTLLDKTHASPAVTYNAPLTGATVTLTANTANEATLVLEPAATIAACTIVLPTAPADGYKVNISTTQIITTVTLTAGGADTIVTGIVTFAAAGSAAAMVYRASSAKWYRIG